jgi:hypothetical protein
MYKGVLMSNIGLEAVGCKKIVCHDSLSPKLAVPRTHLHGFVSGWLCSTRSQKNPIETSCSKLIARLQRCIVVVIGIYQEKT